MMTAPPSDREDLYKSFLAALDRVSLKAAMAQCKKAFEAGPPQSMYLERPLILDLPKPQPNVNITINLVGE